MIGHVPHQLIIKPNFLKGKNNDDLAPITTLICPLAIPFPKRFFIFFVIPECQIIGLKPKNSLNFFSNCDVSPISGNKY